MNLQKERTLTSLNAGVLDNQIALTVNAVNFLISIETTKMISALMVEDKHIPVIKETNTGN